MFLDQWDGDLIDLALAMSGESSPPEMDQAWLRLQPTATALLWLFNTWSLKNHYHFFDVQPVECSTVYL